MKPYCRILMLLSLPILLSLPAQLAQAIDCPPGQLHWIYWYNGAPSEQCGCTIENPDIDPATNKPIPWIVDKAAHFYFTQKTFGTDWSYDLSLGVTTPWYYAAGGGVVNGVVDGFNKQTLTPINGPTKLSDSKDWIATKTIPVYVTGGKLETSYKNYKGPIDDNAMAACNAAFATNAPPPQPVNLCANFIPPTQSAGQCKQWVCDAGKAITAAATDGTPCDPGFPGFIGSCSWGSCQNLVPTSTAKPVKPATLVAGKQFVCNLDNGVVSCFGKIPNTSNTIVAQIVGKASQVTNAVSLSAADNHVCALLNDSSVKCWGQNIAASIPYDPYANIAPAIPLQDPTVITDASGKKIMGVTQVISTPGNDMFLLTDGSLVYRGYSFSNIYPDTSSTMAAPLAPFKLSGKATLQISRNLALFTDHTASGFGALDISNGYLGVNIKFPATQVTDISSLQVGNKLPFFGLIQDAYGSKVEVVDPTLSNSYYQKYGGGNSYPSFGVAIDSSKGKLITDNLNLICYTQDALKPSCLKLGINYIYIGAYYGGYDGLTFTQEKLPIDDIFTEIASTDSSTCIKIVGGQVKCWGENKYGEMGNFENVIGTPQCVNGKAGCFTTSGKIGLGKIYATQSSQYDTPPQLSCNQTAPSNYNNVVDDQYLTCDGSSVKIQFPQTGCSDSSKKPSCSFGNAVCTENGQVQCDMQYFSTKYTPFCQNGQATCIIDSTPQYGTPSCGAKTYDGSITNGCVNVYGEMKYGSSLVCSNGIPTCKDDGYYSSFYYTSMPVDPDKAILCASTTDQPKCVLKSELPVSAVCGNGKLETGEQCDNGSNNGYAYSNCTAYCTLKISDPYGTPPKDPYGN